MVFLPRPARQGIIARLHGEIIKSLLVAEVSARLVSLGADPADSTPEEFVTIIRTDLTRMARLVKESGAKAD